MQKFSSQLAAVVMLRPLARAFKGKDSPVTTHAHGPLKIVSSEYHRGSACTDPAACEEENVDAHEGDQTLVCDNRVWHSSTDAGDNKLTDTHSDLSELVSLRQQDYCLGCGRLTAPNMRRDRRPQVSTRYNPGIVLTTLTTLVIMLTINGLSMPEFEK